MMAHVPQGVALGWRIRPFQGRHEDGFMCEHALELGDQTVSLLAVMEPSQRIPHQSR